MATTQKLIRTANGMAALNTSLSATTDLFSSIGSLRNRASEEIVSRFENAWNENPEHALRISLYSRDVIQGQGERNTPRQIWLWLAQNQPDALRKNLHKIPELGYWKDLLILFGTPVEAEVLALIAQGLSEKNGLCAKWMPRKGPVANKIRKFLNLSPKDYRKTLVELTKVVETQMCSGNWDQINYQHVPSKASKLYRKAFKKRDATRYEEFIGAVEKGEAKINAKALFPHDLVTSYLGYGVTLDRTIEAQWKALPNFMAGNNKSILPICDVSGSMSGLPLQVCIALGIYLSERNEGPFKNAFITFHSTPKLEVLRGTTLLDRVNQLKIAEWGGSTNIESTFKLILKAAVQNNVPEEMMPGMLLICSDMQFNTCTSNADASAFNMVAAEYAKAGYKMPQLVFWNLNASGNYPVSYNQQGVALVSGFSPSIMKQLLAAEDMSPESIMLKTIMNERYNVVL